MVLLFVLVREVQAQPPFLVATGGKQEIVHDGTSNPQVFPPQKWNIIAPQTFFGATVHWEATPFQHVTEPEYQADVKMDVRIRNTTQDARWTAVNPSDRSNISSGYQRPVVVAMSRGRGNGQIELVVTFIESPTNIPIVGDYESVVVATITEN